MASSLEIVGARCESLDDPIGLDTLEPRLSWLMESDRRGQKQTAYQLLVATSPDKLNQDIGDLWDTGKVESDQSIHIRYAGRPLLSLMDCHWKVRVWDRDGNPSEWGSSSRWRMGLLEPDDWKAEWIGNPVNLDDDEVIVSKAIYQTLDGSVAVDVTAIVRELLADSEMLTVSPVILGGDPAPGIVKELVVEYARNRVPATARAQDFAALYLTENRGKPTQLFRREFEFRTAPESALVTVHSPGYFELYLNGAKVGDDVLTPAVSNLDHRTFTVIYDVSQLLRPGKNCLGLWLAEGWADDLTVRAQLDAIVSGNHIFIGTDRSWTSHESGLFKIGDRRWGDFGGERFDARAHIVGWSEPGFDDSSWTKAADGVSPNGAVVSQPSPLNRIGNEITADSVTALDGGRYEIDFGTALTGWLRMKMPELPAGTAVKLYFADVERDGEYQHFNQISEFISGGNAGEVFENKFNYAGFRYVVIDGLPSAPAKEDAAALLIESDLEDAGSFECSNELFNRIHDLTQWTQRCLNLGGYYVDCPHRERMGYGDGQVAAEGFMTSYKADRFYQKWLTDWRLRQGPEGEMPHMAPFGTGGGGARLAGTARRDHLEALPLLRRSANPYREL